MITTHGKTDPLKIYLVAGEPSGDLLGAGLMHALKKKSPGELVFYGVGGPLMEAEGLSSLFPMVELSIMGLVEVIPHIPRVLKRLQQTAQHVREIKPDLIITLDSPGFNFRLARKLKKFNMPLLVHYTAPTVWAWRAGRARKTARLYHHLLTLFKFEPDYFNIHGLKSTFVGHPLTEKKINRIEPGIFRQQFKIPLDHPLLCILPGSRQGELDKMLPIFGNTLQKLVKLLPDLKIVIPTLLHLQKQIEEFVQAAGISAQIITNQVQKYQAMRACNAALAASGTVTLELLIAQTPMIIGYKVNKLTEWIVKPLLKTPYIALPNILAEKEIVKEYLQESCNPENLCEAVYQLLTNEQINTTQRLELEKLQNELWNGKELPSERAADTLLTLLKKNTDSQQ